VISHWEAALARLSWNAVPIRSGYGSSAICEGATPVARLGPGRGAAALLQTHVRTDR
jgi:hypothetical protein